MSSRAFPWPLGLLLPPWLLFGLLCGIPYPPSSPHWCSQPPSSSLLSPHSPRWCQGKSHGSGNQGLLQGGCPQLYVWPDLPRELHPQIPIAQHSHFLVAQTSQNPNPAPYLPPTSSVQGAQLHPSSGSGPDPSRPPFPHAPFFIH